MPRSQLTIVPGTSHVLLFEKPALVTGIVADFLTTEPVATMAPIRRAQRKRQLVKEDHPMKQNLATSTNSGHARTAAPNNHREGSTTR